MSKATASDRKPGRPPATETREKILEAALNLFSEKGYDAASVARVAELAGLSKQALQHHFPNKAELRAAIYERLGNSWDELHTQMEPALTSFEDAQYGTLLEMASLLFEQHVVVTRFLVREMLDQPDVAMPWLIAHAGPWFATVTAAQQGMQARGLGDESIDAEANLVTSAALMLSLSALLGGSSADVLGDLGPRLHRSARRFIAAGNNLTLDEAGR